MQHPHNKHWQCLLKPKEYVEHIDLSNILNQEHI